MEEKIPNSDFLIENLKNVLSDETYGYASSVITYCETQSLTYTYVGMAELRDALTHIHRALFATDKDKISIEMVSVREHIRRAAVESMQEYVETKYFQIRRRILSSPMKLLFTGRKIDWEAVKQSEKAIKINIL